MNSPDFWKWQYHICRKWQPPKGFNKTRIVGFALILASWGNDGKGIRPSAATLAKAVGMSRSTAIEMRELVVNFGLFRETGRTPEKIPILEIVMAADATAAEAVSTIAGTQPAPADVFGRTCEHAGTPALHADCPDCKAANARWLASQSPSLTTFASRQRRLP
jgi:hypothetical protein